MAVLEKSKYREERMKAVGTALTENKYNAVIGSTVLWGIIINFLMARFATGTILRLDYRAALVIYFVGSIGSMLVVYKAQNPVVSFLGFTGLALSMGLLLTYYLTVYTESTIYKAFMLTAIITVIMLIISTLYPGIFLSIGRGLGITLLVCVVVELVGMLIFRSSMDIMDYVVCFVFCGFIGFDWAKAQAFPKTLNNAFLSAADIYLDVINIFIRLLSILGKKD